MESRQLRMILRHAAAAAGCPNGARVSDGELLERFRRQRDEAAFSELVQRYGRLVWAVCRNLVATEADASDAFQATFLALVQNSDRIRDASRLASWLHGVAYRVCSKSRLQSRRRHERERQAARREAGHAVPDSAWDDAMAAVHDEVSRLPESLRVPFVLCCLEGKGATEAAEMLGWKLGTFSGRLSRAKARLLANLDRRGLAIGAVAIATAGASAGGRVPAAVAQRTINLIRDGVSIPNSILNLSQGVVGMTVYRTKLLVAGVGILAMAVSTGVGSRWLSRADAQGKDDPRRAALEALERFQQKPGQWEYKFEPIATESRPMGLSETTRHLTENAGEGWEFCGTTEMSLSTDEFRKLSRGTGKPSESGVYRVSVYKRPSRDGLKRKIDAETAENVKRGIEELMRSIESKHNKQGEYEKQYRDAIEKAHRALEDKQQSLSREQKERASAEMKKLHDLEAEKVKRALGERQRALADVQQERAMAEKKMQELLAQRDRAEMERQKSAKLEDLVRSLQAQLEALKEQKREQEQLLKQNRKLEELDKSRKKEPQQLTKEPYQLKESFKINADTIKLALSAAMKKFGKGSVELVPNEKDDRQIVLVGRPDAVKWTVDMLRKLEQ